MIVHAASAPSSPAASAAATSGNAASMRSPVNPERARVADPSAMRRRTSEAEACVTRSRSSAAERHPRRVDRRWSPSSTRDRSATSPAQAARWASTSRPSASRAAVLASSSWSDHPDASSNRSTSPSAERRCSSASRVPVMDPFLRAPPTFNVSKSADQPVYSHGNPEPVEDGSHASLRPRLRPPTPTPEPGLVARGSRGDHRHTATLPSRGTPLRSPHDGCLDRPPAPPALPGPPDPRTTPRSPGSPDRPRSPSLASPARSA